MEFFRGSHAPEVDEEVNAIIENATVNEHKEGYISGRVRQLASPSFLKPLSCVGILNWSLSISGNGVVTAYSNDYFDNAGAGALSYETDSLILGSVKWILTILAPFLLLKLPKKGLFVLCGFVSSIGFVLGNYFGF